MAWRTTNVTCVERLFRLMAWRTTNVTCVARLFRLMAQRTTNVTCVARLFRLMAQRTTNVTCVARSFRVMALTTTFISYVALVLPHGFKNEVCFMCSTLVSPHGWEIFSLSLANWPPGSPIDSFQDELSLSGPIESVCQHLQLPSLLLTSYFRYHWSSALRPFPGVLDMSGWRRPWGHVCLEEQFKMALIFKMTRFACRKIYYHLSRRTIDERSFHSRSCTTVALGA